MTRLPKRALASAAVLTCAATILAAPAQAFEPSEFDQMSRPIGFDADRRDPPRPIGFIRRDGDGNRVGVAGASSLAAGNIIAVTIEGHGNTVKIDADQKNSGDISSELILNGRVNLGR